MSNTPYSIRIHDKGSRAEISSEYHRVKSSIDYQLNNMSTTNDYVHGYLQPVSDVNEYKQQDIQKRAMQNLVGLSQNYANIHSPLYGDNNEPCHYSMASFLDQHTVLTDPNKTLSMISGGDATPLMVGMFRSTYPSQWSDYVSQSLGHIATTDISDQKRALVYSTTGMETSHFYSRAALEADMQQQAASQGQESQQQRPQERTRQLPAKMIESNEHFSPATSQEGKSS